MLQVSSADWAASPVYFDWMVLEVKRSELSVENEEAILQVNSGWPAPLLSAPCVDFDRSVREAKRSEMMIEKAILQVASEGRTALPAMVLPLLGMGSRKALALCNILW